MPSEKTTVIPMTKILTLSQLPHHTLLAEIETPMLETFSFSLVSMKYLTQMFWMFLSFTIKMIATVMDLTQTIFQVR